MFGSSRSDAAFFEAFSAHAKETLGAARMLEALVALLPIAPSYRAEDVAGERDASGLAKRAEEIKRAESAGDTITHDTLKRLRENWLTPLDRGDIHELVSRMDDVLDEIEAAADRIVLFEVARAKPEARELAATVVSACEALEKAIALLGTMKHADEILKLCVEVNRLENAADRLHRKAMSELFRPESDPLVVMKWKDIFESLEAAADRCEDVADVIEGVVLEYA